MVTHDALGSFGKAVLPLLLAFLVSLTLRPLDLHSDVHLGIWMWAAMWSGFILGRER